MSSVYDAGARPIIFLHIPKTAGTTVSDILRRQYAAHQIYEDEFDRAEVRARFEALPAEEKRRYHLFRGHLPFGFHTYLARPATYFTFLRHPVDRVLSHYYYVRSRPDLFGLHDAIVRDRLSLYEIIEQDLIVDISNMQTRYLAGLPHLFPANAYTEAHLDSARHNLAAYFGVVGLVEQFDASLLLLRHAFGWRDCFYVRRNVTRRPAREAIAPETVTLIERKEAYDMALYRFAKQLFAAQRAAYGTSFERDLARFRLLNRVAYAPLAGMRQWVGRVAVLGRRRRPSPGNG